MHVVFSHDCCARVAKVPSECCLRAANLSLCILLCRALVEEDVEAVEPFRGKRLMGALSGLRVTRNTGDFNRMMQKCKEEDFQIFLPNGKHMSTGDGCIVSPHPPACARGPAPCASRRATPVHCRRHLAISLRTPCSTRMMPSCVLRKVPPLAVRSCVSFI